MKKSILFLACAAILSVGCAKDDHEEVTPEKGKRHFTLRATVDEPGTRLSVSNSGKFSWQQDDEIVYLTESDGSYNDPKRAYTYSDAPTGDFEIELDEDETVRYAMYPLSEFSKFSTSANAHVFGLDDNYVYKLGSTYMPMLGSNFTIDDDNMMKASFRAVGGVLKLTVKNFPVDEEDNIEYLRFSVPNKKITGTFPILEDSDGVKYIETVDNTSETNYIDFFFGGGYYDKTMTFYFPLPCGTYNNLKFELFNGGEDPIYSKTAKIEGGLIVHRNEVITAPSLSL